MKTLLITLSTIGIACCVTGIVLVKSMRLVPSPLDHAPTLSAQHAPKFHLNEDNVYAEIMRHDIKFSDIVLRQAILETGHFTSHNCRERNNLFGMKGGQKTSDNIHGYAIYPTWMESVAAYKKWQHKRLTDQCGNYYQFLVDWNYAESEEYERKLRSIPLVIVRP